MWAAQSNYGTFSRSIVTKHCDSPTCHQSTQRDGAGRDFGNCVDHQVQPSDTLVSLALKYNTTVSGHAIVQRHALHGSKSWCDTTHGNPPRKKRKFASDTHTCRIIMTLCFMQVQDICFANGVYGSRHNLLLVRKTLRIPSAFTVARQEEEAPREEEQQTTRHRRHSHGKEISKDDKETRRQRRESQP